MVSQAPDYRGYYPVIDSSRYRHQIVYSLSRSLYQPSNPSNRQPYWHICKYMKQHACMIRTGLSNILVYAVA